MNSENKPAVENITKRFLDMIKLPDKTCKNLNYLIALPVQADMRSQYRFPVGFGLVSSSLKASGRTVFTLNLTYRKKPFELLKETIINNNIDVIATGGLSGQYTLLREIIDAAKSIRSDIITIVGGGIVTAEPEVAMKAFENADYGVIGEGEITINALAYALETCGNITEVEGIIGKNSCGYFITSPREEIIDLDCLPFPDYDGFDYIEMFERRYSGISIVSDIGVTIVASRSCPCNCTFCFHSSGKKYRRRSLDNLFGEIDWLKSKFPFKRAYICDELFGGDFTYVREFCARIKSYGIKYKISTRMSLVNAETLELLKESGCSEIMYGVEHVNEKILKSMKKHTSSEFIEPTFNLTIEKGIRPDGCIIFGDLEETAETVNEALNWWCEHRNFGIYLLNIMTFPGSHIYKVACGRGIISDPVQYLRDGCPMVNISKMSDNEWSQMKDKIAQTRILYEGYDLNTKPDTARISKVLDTLANGNDKVCVWPATNDTIRFFRNISKPFYRNAYFVNINPDSILLRTADAEYDCKIYEPDVIRKENIGLVVCPNIKLINEIQLILEREYPGVDRVLSIPELENFKTEKN
ncbi:MAG: B12-binding domain-containing radical SAM protein [Chitinispirillales bacterium]|nr:B12-binding domain-containing radical SAM protein [Chitinispirillales bacterium]